MTNDAKIQLAKVFLTMLKTQGVENVSVSQLCNKSGFSRETFYYHFHDKYDLMSWIYGKQKRDIMDKYFASEPWSKTVCRVLYLVREYATFYRKGFSSTSYQNLERVMNDYTNDIFITVIRELTGKEVISDEMTFYIKFNSHGAVAMTKEWVESNMIMDEKELSILIAESMPPKVKEYLEKYFEKINHNHELRHLVSL